MPQQRLYLQDGDTAAVMAWVMATQTAAADQVTRELHRVLDNMRVELDRIEILAAGLAAFSTPVPDYEPTFHHTGRLLGHAQELGREQ